MLDVRLFSRALIVAGSFGLGAGLAAAQEGMPPAPKPGPEHEVLKQDVGTWDATVEMLAPGGQPPVVSTGVETVTELSGGLWTVTDFKSTLMGQPFHGHGTTGYDPVKKKHVFTWVDSMSTGIYLGEGDYDAKTKTLKGWMEGPDPSGKTTRMTQSVQWKDADTRVFTMSGPGPDGKEVPAMRITYKRRK